MDWQTDFVCVNCERDVDDGTEGSFQNESMEEMGCSKVYLRDGSMGENRYRKRILAYAICEDGIIESGEYTDAG